MIRRQSDRRIRAPMAGRLHRASTVPAGSRPRAGRSGLVVGAIAGIAGSAAMNAFRAAVDGRRDDPAALDAGDPGALAIAAAISRRVFRHRLRAHQRAPAANAVRYAIGTGSGAIYGAIAEAAPSVAAARGLGYGAALWALGDEIALPLLGLAAPPNAVPLTARVYALASHLVYGIVTDAVRRSLRGGARRGPAPRYA